MSIKEGLKNSKIGQFWLKHKEKIMMAIGIVLIAAVSFEAGYLQGQQKNKNDSIVINKVAGSEQAHCEENQTEIGSTAAKNPLTNNSATGQNIRQPDSQITEKKTCAFVASKNSNKYHLPTCTYAQKIKPENRICFSSKEEAESRGYVGAKCCIK